LRAAAVGTAKFKDGSLLVAGAGPPRPGPASISACSSKPRGGERETPFAPI